MQAIVSPLQGSAAEAFARLAGDVTSVSGVMPSRVQPHFTFAAAAQFDLAAVEPALRSIARSCVPFSTRAAGLGLFTEPATLLHLALTRTARLNLLHRTIHQEAARVAAGEDANFTSERWVPHVTLATGFVSPERLGMVISTLLLRDLTFEVPVLSLAVVEQTGDGLRVHAQFTLEG